KNYEIALFRLIQEALQNAVTHAEATEIKVKIEIFESTVTLVIQDNGQGFDPKIIKDDSFGLIGMRERVEMINGTFKIDTQIGKGTKIFVNIPDITFEND
ncbi:MAG TPA: ATP-binding protein, partial [Bacillota bacterium]|nr:ATP-binding protein [Bacillota bacterium]